MTLAALSLAVLAAAAACAAPRPASAPAAMESAAVKPPGEAHIGDRTVCPVSGEQFLVSDTSPKAEVDGKTYYFCCSDCVKRFEQEPAKYLNKPPG